MNNDISVLQRSWLLHQHISGVTCDNVNCLRQQLMLTLSRYRVKLLGVVSEFFE